MKKKQADSIKIFNEDGTLKTLFEISNELEKHKHEGSYMVDFKKYVELVFIYSSKLGILKIT